MADTLKAQISLKLISNFLNVCIFPRNVIWERIVRRMFCFESKADTNCLRSTTECRLLSLALLSVENEVVRTKTSFELLLLQLRKT